MVDVQGKEKGWASATGASALVRHVPGLLPCSMLAVPLLKSLLAACCIAFVALLLARLLLNHLHAACCTAFWLAVLQLAISGLCPLATCPALAETPLLDMSQGEV